MKRTLAFVVLMLCSSHCFGQASASVALFLLVPPSPEANGMGGISGCLPGSDPFAQIANPGQLGAQMLSQNLLAGSYLPKTQWLPGIGPSDLSYRVSAASAGLNLRELIPIPFDVAVGLGYSSVHLDYGEMAFTTNDPATIQTSHAWEELRALSFGIGLDLLVKIGVGVNAKRIEMNLAPMVTPQLRTPSAIASATDVGVIAIVPFTRLVPSLATVVPVVEPVLDLSVSYTRSNIGDEVRFGGSMQADPLPRLATVGMSVEIGATSRVGEREWKVFGLTLARQSESVLATRSETGAIEYRSGIGNISVFKNLVLSRRSEGADLRKGFQVGVLEVFYYRSGSADGVDLVPVNTSGMGFRLAGVWQILRVLDRSVDRGGILGYLMDHLDLTYSTSMYHKQGSPIDDTRFSGLTMVLHSIL